MIRLDIFKGQPDKTCLLKRTTSTNEGNVLKCDWLVKSSGHPFGLEFSSEADALIHFDMEESQ